MGFLAPAFLALAAFAGVPLLVHLLRRRVGRTVDFPAVRYLARMEQEHSRERKLRHRLLLLLRLLAALALAFAAARPIARFAGLGHAPVAVALVIDNSMSSGAVRDGRAVIDDIRNDARSLLQSLTPDDRAWIITADGRIVGGTKDVLERTIAELQPLGGRGDLVTATLRARTLAESGAPRAPVVAVITDGQASSWQSGTIVTDSAIRTSPRTRDVPVRMLLRPARPLRNAAVLHASVSPQRWTPSGVVDFSVMSADSLPWRIALDGRTVARGTAPASRRADQTSVTNASSATNTANASMAANSTTLSQRLSSSANGWVRGSIELNADELRGDDTRWFAVRVAPPPTVAIHSEAGPFLNAALATMVDDRRLLRGPAGASGVVTVSGADAVVARMPVFLTAPLDPVRVGEANRTLARLGVPWRFGAIARNTVLARGAADLEGAQVRVRYPLQHSPGSGASRATSTSSRNAQDGAAGNATPAAGTVDTLATAGGSPWVVAGDGYLVIGSPIDPDATDLPLRAAFVPWVLSVLSQRLGDDGRVLKAAPGASLVDRGLLGMSALERPDGSLLPLAGDRLTVPNESGVYFLRRQGSRVGALVVNPDASESDTTFVGSADMSATLQDRVHSSAVAVDTVPGAWREHTLDQAAGRALLMPLLVLALLALLLEALLSRGAAPGPSPVPTSAP